MDVEGIRSDFPILNDVIYMDSASTSLTPEPVLEAVLEYYREYNANVGRGVHRLSQIASTRYDDAHRKVARFIGARKEGLIFTKNSTEAINMVALGLGLRRGDRVVTTLLEHHSNLLPWMQLKKLGVDIGLISPDKDGLFNLSDFEYAIDGKTKVVAVTHASNVLGTISPIREISRICREKDVLLLVDGAQSTPHMRVNVRELDCDFFILSGHKMLGPTGTGVLWAKDPETIEPLFYGGGMIEDVSTDACRLASGYERFEAGTPHIAGGIGIGRAVDYLEGIGMDALQEHEARMTTRLLEGLLDIRGVEVYGSHDPKERIGVVSFNIEGLNPHDVALMLDDAAGIMVRSGHHCCIPLMKHLELKMGTVRASLYIYNTEEEIDRLLEVVREIARTV
ncbi:Cysteine desulfurase [Candidatus Methanoperedenaceae archaeon GB50]|nr:Cysteine desulfurase [Candidatus Methanoperedenaceae archaeon GB50]CAD7775533.1 MAG: Cysteine desulfurase [Candidatus Methanoperedenaceae archaeon GB50]